MEFPGVAANGFMSADYSLDAVKVFRCSAAPVSRQSETEAYLHADMEPQHAYGDSLANMASLSILSGAPAAQTMPSLRSSALSGPVSCRAGLRKTIAPSSEAVSSNWSSPKATSGHGRPDCVAPGGGPEPGPSASPATIDQAVSNTANALRCATRGLMLEKDSPFLPSQHSYVTPLSSASVRGCFSLPVSRCERQQQWHGLSQAQPSSSFQAWNQPGLPPVALALQEHPDGCSTPHSVQTGDRQADQHPGRGEEAGARSLMGRGLAQTTTAAAQPGKVDVALAPHSPLALQPTGLNDLLRGPESALRDSCASQLLSRASDQSAACAMAVPLGPGTYVPSPTAAYPSSNTNTEHPRASTPLHRERQGSDGQLLRPDATPGGQDGIKQSEEQQQEVPQMQPAAGDPQLDGGGGSFEALQPGQAPLPDPIEVTVGPHVVRKNVKKRGRDFGKLRGRDTGSGRHDDSSDDSGPLRRASRGGMRGGGSSGGHAGSVRGIFHPELYMSGGDCIQVNGTLVSRSRFEKLGGSPMAKWYRSIRVVQTAEPLGHWLQRHDLPIFTGKARQRRQRSLAIQANEGSDHDHDRTIAGDAGSGAGDGQRSVGGAGSGDGRGGGSASPTGGASPNGCIRPGEPEAVAAAAQLAASTPQTDGSGVGSASMSAAAGGASGYVLAVAFLERGPADETGRRWQSLGRSSSKIRRLSSGTGAAASYPDSVFGASVEEGTEPPPLLPPRGSCPQPFRHSAGGGSCGGACGIEQAPPEPAPPRPQSGLPGHTSCGVRHEKRAHVATDQTLLQLRTEAGGNTEPCAALQDSVRCEQRGPTELACMEVEMWPRGGGSVAGTAAPVAVANLQPQPSPTMPLTPQKPHLEAEPALAPTSWASAPLPAAGLVSGAAIDLSVAPGTNAVPAARLGMALNTEPGVRANVSHVPIKAAAAAAVSGAAADAVTPGAAAPTPGHSHRHSLSGTSSSGLAGMDNGWRARAAGLATPAGEPSVMMTAASPPQQPTDALPLDPDSERPAGPGPGSYLVRRVMSAGGAPTAAPYRGSDGGQAWDWSLRYSTPPHPHPSPAHYAFPPPPFGVPPARTGMPPGPPPHGLWPSHAPLGAPIAMPMPGYPDIHPQAPALAHLLNAARELSAAPSSLAAVGPSGEGDDPQSSPRCGRAAVVLGMEATAAAGDLPPRAVAMATTTAPDAVVTGAVQPPTPTQARPPAAVAGAGPAPAASHGYQYADPTTDAAAAVQGATGLPGHRVHHPHGPTHGYWRHGPYPYLSRAGVPARHASAAAAGARYMFHSRFGRPMPTGAVLLPPSSAHAMPYGCYFPGPYYRRAPNGYRWPAAAYGYDFMPYDHPYVLAGPFPMERTRGAVPPSQRGPKAVLPAGVADAYGSIPQARRLPWAHTPQGSAASAAAAASSGMPAPAQGSVTTAPMRPPPVGAPAAVLPTPLQQQARGMEGAPPPAGGMVGAPPPVRPSVAAASAPEATGPSPLGPQSQPASAAAPALPPGLPVVDPAASAEDALWECSPGESFWPQHGGATADVWLQAPTWSTFSGDPFTQAAQLPAASQSLPELQPPPPQQVPPREGVMMPAASTVTAPVPEPATAGAADAMGEVAMAVEAWEGGIDAAWFLESWDL